MAERPKRAFAAAAHPDDIEFMMAGTLMLLRDAGYEIHYMNIANGDRGTAVHSRDEITRIREAEGREAARLAGAVFHPSLASDLEVFYDTPTLERMTAVMREVNPEILLVPSPQDYMEDHINAQRVAVASAFFRGMVNLVLNPPVDPVGGDLTVYHALPYGLRDALRRRVWAGQYVDVTSVIDAKREMLSAHKSQKEWLDTSQGMDAYLDQMVEMSREVGVMSRAFKYAEGWRRHSHLGFSESDRDPLTEALGERVVTDEAYERGLEQRP